MVLYSPYIVLTANQTTQMVLTLIKKTKLLAIAGFLFTIIFFRQAV